MTQDKTHKVSNVPPLRFPEFSGEWERIRVSDLLDFYSTNSLSWDQLEYENTNILNLHYGLIHVGLPTLIDLHYNKLPNIKQNNLPKSYELCQEGDVAFADASEDTSEVAKVVEFFNLDGKQVVCGLHTIHGRDNSGKTIKGFKGYALSSQPFHFQIRRLAQGTKIYSVSSKNFDESFISLPSKAEQKKIVSLLFLLDQRISTQIRVIDKLESLIKGIVVTHFSNVPNKQVITIADLGEAYSVGNLSKEDLSVEGEPCILYGELFTTYGCVAQCITSKTNKFEQATLSKINDLLFPASTTVDAVSLIAPTSIQTDGVYVAGDLFGIHVSNKYNSQYISYLLNYVYKKELAKYAQGSTIIHLHYDDIKNAQISVPTLLEQNKCSQLLSLQQKKLTAERSLLNMYQVQKAYLLQNMFI